MNNLMKGIGLVLLATVLFTPVLHAEQHVGEVIEVEPVYSTRTYYEHEEIEQLVCRSREGRGWIERGTNTIFGSVEGLVGAAVGVAIGSQIGGGSGTEVAKVVGGVIGNRVGNSRSSDGDECQSERVRRRVPRTEQYVREYEYAVLFDGLVYRGVRRSEYMPIGSNIVISVGVR